MKNLIIIFVVFFTCCISFLSALATMPTNIVFTKIAQATASNDVQTVVRTLPEVESLWPEQSDVYFQSAKEAATFLAGTKNREAREALSILQTNVLRKSLPATEQQVVTCLGLKRDIILLFLNTEYIGTEKSRWTDLLGFLAEVRSRIVPNYVNQGGMISVSAHTPEQQARLEVLIKENEKRLTSDRVQHDLQDTASDLTRYLLRNLPHRLRKDASFVKAAASAAKLTEEEVKELKGEN